MAHTQDGTHVRVTRTIAATPEQLWAVLADPRRHVELDGSGMLQAADDSEPLTAVGQVFSMDMQNRWIGDYRTHNTVTELEPGRRISWATAREGQPPAGVWWTWELTPTETGTDVLHVYDWSRVVDPAVLARVSFPRVTPDELETTMGRLAAAVEG